MIMFYRFVIIEEVCNCKNLYCYYLIELSRNTIEEIRMKKPKLNQSIKTNKNNILYLI